jgi:probable F420-dependent oxidoreductase
MTGDELQFGVVVPTEFGRDRDQATCLQEVVETAQFVDRGRFDSLWVGEHHFMDHIYFDNLQTLSHLAGLTENVLLGTSVCLVPQYNPVRLAERIANLDIMANGRFVFGGSVGYREEEFEVLGVDRSRRGRRTTEALALMDRLWREDEVTFSGEEFEFEDVSINPKPVQDGGPDVWLGGRAPAALRRAAEMADGWFVDPRISFDELTDPDEYYREQVAQADREPTARPLWREVFVAETTDAAIDRARDSLMAKYEAYLSWNDDQGAETEPDEDQFADLMTDRFLVGSAETVVEEIERYRSAYNFDHLVLRSRWPGMDAEVAMGSLRRFECEVVPHFR